MLWLRDCRDRNALQGCLTCSIGFRSTAKNEGFLFFNVMTYDQNRCGTFKFQALPITIPESLDHSQDILYRRTGVVAAQSCALWCPLANQASLEGA